MTDFNPAWVLRPTLLGLLLFSGCSKTTEPTEEDFSDRAAYVLIVRGDNALYTIRADGTRPERIGEGYWPLVSPDGKLVAFRQSGGSSTLFVCDISSGLTRQILSTENWDRYAWSPASDRIVFSGSRESTGYAIRVVTIASGAVDSLTEGFAGSQRYPHWLPDSVTIAYTQKPGILSPSTICSYSLENGSVTETEVPPGDMEWSPDGEMLFAGGHIVAWPSLELIEDFPGVTSEVYYCKWFPDSKHLFIRTNTDTYRFNIETKAFGWISADRPGNAEFTVSSDGMLAGYIPSPGNHLTVMNSDGLRKTSITIPGVGSYTYMQFAGDTAW